MNDTEPMRLIFPLLDAAAARAAMPVALALSAAYGVPLHLLLPKEQSADRAALARKMALPEDALARVALDPLPDGIVCGTLEKVCGMQPALAILAVRLGRRRATDRHGGTRAPLPAVSRRAAHQAEEAEREIVEHAACPVLIVPPEKPLAGWRLRRILLPQDGTADCAAALGHVLRESFRIGVEVLVLRVAGAGIGQPREAGSLATPRYVDHPQYEWESWAQEFLGRIAAGVDPATVRLRLSVATGDPSEEILRAAEKESADMILLPWHCSLAPGRARMIKAVLNGATCPVLLLPERMGEEGGLKAEREGRQDSTTS